MEKCVVDKMLKRIATAINQEYRNFLLLSLPFLLLNITKVLFFHAELVHYQQDFTNFLYVLLFTGAWIGLLFALVQHRCSWLITFWILQLLYISINFSYFFYYGSYLSIQQAVSLLGEFYDLSKKMSIPLHPKLLLYLIDLPILLFVVKQGKFPLHNKVIRRILIVICTVMLVLLYAYRIPQLDNNTLRSYRKRFIGSFGLLTMQVSDLFVEGHYYNQLSTDNLPVHSSGQSKVRQNDNIRPKNIIFIQVETLDANILLTEHDEQPVMPFLSQLAQENIYFPYMLAYHEGGGTSDADFSVLNTIQPLEDYAAINLPNYNYENSLVKRFIAADYSTSAFHGNIGRYWNRDVAFSKMGFQNFYDLEKMDLIEYGWGAKDDDVFAFVAEQLRSAKEPLFYYIITMSSHGPFKNIDRYYSTNRFDSLPMSHPDKAYYKAMAYVDKSIQSFFESGAFDLSDTVVFIFGDHSEYYTVDKGTRRAVIRDKDLKLEFVPLIIISDLPAIQEHLGRYNWAVSFLDIAPTALELSGIEYRIHSQGCNVLEKMPASPDEDIPFNGYAFSREKLFEMAARTR